MRELFITGIFPALNLFFIEVLNKFRKVAAGRNYSHYGYILIRKPKGRNCIYFRKDGRDKKVEIVMTRDIGKNRNDVASMFRSLALIVPQFSRTRDSAGRSTCHIGPAVLMYFSVFTLWLVGSRVTFALQRCCLSHFFALITCDRFIHRSSVLNSYFGSKSRECRMLHTTSTVSWIGFRSVLREELGFVQFSLETLAGLVVQDWEVMQITKKAEALTALSDFTMHCEDDGSEEHQGGSAGNGRGERGHGVLRPLSHGARPARGLDPLELADNGIPRGASFRVSFANVTFFPLSLLPETATCARVSAHKANQRSAEADDQISE